MRTPRPTTSDGGAAARRSRRRTVLGATALAVAATTVLQPTETLASYADDVFVKNSTAFTASTFGIEGSLDNSSFSEHATYPAAMDLQGSASPGTIAFTTPIRLTSGGTSYAPLYLRTTSTSAAATKVSMSAAAKQETQPSTSSLVSDTALWNTYVTYGVRAVPTTTSARCDSTVFSGNQGTPLLAETSAMTAAAPAATFALSASSASTYMVCFSFTLVSSVASGSPSSNGKSVYPYWTFTGQS